MNTALWSEGRFGRRKPQQRWVDVEREAPSELHVIDLARTEATIRAVSADPNAVAAAARIDGIWARVEEVAALAESRMRILLKRVAPPNLGAEPAWLGDALRQLVASEEAREERLHPSAVETTRRLVRAVVAEIPDAHAELEVTPGGGISVVWRSPRTLRWTVTPARLPWPGVNCRMYVQTGERAHNVEARTVHLAHAAIELTVGRLDR